MKLSILSLVCEFILWGCKSASSELPEIILPLNAPEIQKKKTIRYYLLASVNLK